MSRRIRGLPGTTPGIVAAPTWPNCQRVGDLASGSHMPGHEEPSGHDLDSTEQQMIAVCDNKGVSADRGVPRKNKVENPAIITNRRQKNTLLRWGRKLKGSNIYVIERLIKKNVAIAHLLRKQSKIQSAARCSWSWICHHKRQSAGHQGDAEMDKYDDNSCESSTPKK